MTPETVAPMTPEPAKIGEFARLGGVLFEPGKTFADIARRPTFLLPMVLMIIVSFAFLTLFGQRVGWERTIREQMESSSSSQQLSPEQREKQIEMGSKFAGIGASVGAVIGTPIIDLAIAGILLGIVAGMMSAPVKFKQVLAVVCWAWLPNLISGVLAIVVLFLKNPDDFNLKNPLAFNPGAFLDPLTTSKFVYSLATSLDLFVFWVILLMAVGLKAAGGKKFAFSSALFAVVLPWAVYVLGKSALAGLF